MITSLPQEGVAKKVGGRVLDRCSDLRYHGATGSPDADSAPDAYSGSCAICDMWRRARG
jgi:hypothetical protein